MSEEKNLSRISTTTFIAGLIVAILASSLVSTLVAMTVIQGPQGEQGPQGPMGPQGLAGPSKIPLASQYRAFCDSTSSALEWVNIDGMSGAINVDRISTLLIVFSSELEGVRSSPGTTWVWIRALVNGESTYPYKGSVGGMKSLEIRYGEVTPEFYHSGVFYDNVSAGTHTVRIQWKVGAGDAIVTSCDRSLIVIALPIQ